MTTSTPTRPASRRRSPGPTPGWPVPTAASRALFERANAVSPGGVQGEGRSATPVPAVHDPGPGLADLGRRRQRVRRLPQLVRGGAARPQRRRGSTRAVVRAMDEHGVSFSAANPLEVELAERLVGMIPSAERVVFSCTGHRGDVPRDPARPRLHRPRADPQVRGQLPRLARLRRVEPPLRDRRAAATSRRPSPASAGIPAAIRDLVLVREYNDAAGVRDAPRATRATRSRRSSSSRSSTTPAWSCPSPGFLESAPRGLHRSRDGPHLRRGDHRVPPRTRRRPGRARRHARPHDDGQGDRQRLPDLGPGRPGGHHGPPRPEGRRPVRGHVRRPHARTSPRPSPAREVVLEGSIHDHLRAARLAG